MGKKLLVKGIINLLIAALNILCIRSRNTDQVIIGQEDDELSAHAVTGIAVVGAAPELHAVSLCFARNGSCHTGIA